MFFVATINGVLFGEHVLFHESYDLEGVNTRVISACYPSLRATRTIHVILACFRIANAQGHDDLIVQKLIVQDRRLQASQTMI